MLNVCVYESNNGIEGGVMFEMSHIVLLYCCWYLLLQLAQQKDTRTYHVFEYIEKYPLLDYAHSYTVVL